jgi:hypothetical protein
MKIKDHVWECFMALAGVVIAVLVVSIWSGCAVPATEKTAMPMPPHPSMEMAATSAASPASDTGLHASAQAPSASYDPNAPLRKLRGVVQNLEADTGTLVVMEPSGSTREFKVDATAKITKGGDFTAIALSDVNEGDHVTLGCRGTVVVSLHVKVIAAP